MLTYKTIVMCTEHATGALRSMQACILSMIDELAPPSSQQSTVEPLYADTISSSANLTSIC